jgi:hypothetical protein
MAKLKCQRGKAKGERLRLRLRLRRSSRLEARGEKSQISNAKKIMTSDEHGHVSRTRSSKAGCRPLSAVLMITDTKHEHDSQCLELGTPGKREGRKLYDDFAGVMMLTILWEYRPNCEDPILPFRPWDLRARVFASGPPG